MYDKIRKNLCGRENMSNAILDKELKKRAIPDVLTLPNGEKVTTKEQWEKELRPYWYSSLQAVLR